VYHLSWTAGIKAFDLSGFSKLLKHLGEFWRRDGDSNPG
jgi:hypothetical protein